MLSHTVVAALDNIFHFSMVFVFICTMLAWLACWSFGPDKALFSTLGYAFMTQLQMVMGEFPFDDPWKETVLERAWYVCYAVLIFFLAVNIFLAIIVEAFVLVKRRLADEEGVERSILVDCIGLLRYRLLGRALNLPQRLEVARHLHVTRHFLDVVTSKELKQSKFLNFKNRIEAQHYMDFYYGLLGEDILCKQGREFLKLKHRQKETHRCLVVLFNVPEELMDKSAKTIQKAWQDYVQRKQESKCKPELRKTSKSKRLTASFHDEDVSSSTSENTRFRKTLPTLLANGVEKHRSHAALRGASHPHSAAQGLVRLFSK